MGAECDLARGCWRTPARILQTLAFFSSSTSSSCFCFLLAARLAAASGVPFLGAAFLGAAFLGAAFLGAAFLGAAFLGAAFLGAAFFLGAGADLALFAAGASAEAAGDRFLGGIGEVIGCRLQLENTQRSLCHGAANPKIIRLTGNKGPGLA